MPLISEVGTVGGYAVISTSAASERYIRCPAPPRAAPARVIPARPGAGCPVFKRPDVLAADGQGNRP